MPDASTQDRADPGRAYLLLANPGATDTVATVTFIKSDGTTLTRAFPISAGRRVTLQLATAVPALAGEAFGMKVEATSAILAERSMYWTVGGVPLAGGTSTRGIPIP